MNTWHLGAITGGAVEGVVCGVEMAKLGNTFCGRKRAQVVKYLPHKHEGLGSNLCYLH